MRRTAILSLIVTATLARTNRENKNIRKRSLTTATTPFGNFDDLENDFVISMVPPPVMQHKTSKGSTKSTSPPLEEELPKSGKGKKSSKGKGLEEKSGKGKQSPKGKGQKSPKGKGSGKKDSKKSSSKGTSPPEESAPTTVPNEASPTQSPILSPVATPSTIMTEPPQLSPTFTPVTPTALPTLETQQAPTVSPTPLSSTTLTNPPNPSISTPVPTPLSTTSTSLPTSLSSTSSSLPTIAGAPRTSAPTAANTPSTSIPTLVDTSPSSVPVTLPTGNFETTLNLDRVPLQFHSVFQNAAAKWDTVIVGDLEDYPIFEEDRTNPELLCDGDSLPEIVDDVFICASLPTIDGPNGILGSAGPIYGRLGEFVQTAVGYMEFDLSDIELLEAQGRLNGLILHEMAHVYGTGTLWGQNGLVTDTPDCPYLYDSKASAEYRALSGCDSAVPIETTGGLGTACLHWSESCFQSELMTGVNTGDQELSRISIATLEDMGYVVDYSQADTFTASQLNPTCVCSANSVQESEFELSNGAFVTFRWNENRRSLRHDTSDKEREEAVQYGKRKLQDNHRSAELMSRNADPRRVYLADKVVLVLYFDKDEQIKSVLVTSDT